MGELSERNVESFFALLFVLYKKQEKDRHKVAKKHTKCAVPAGTLPRSGKRI